MGNTIFWMEWSHLYTCDAIRRLPDLWKTYAKTPTFFFNFDLPKPYLTENAYNYFKKELLRFKDALEQISGEEITLERLAESIETHNQTRTLLKELYELRKAPNPPISGAETLEIVKASMTLDKKTYNKKLAELCDELKQKAGRSKEGARILVSGSIVADGDDKIVGLIEEHGGSVVCDDLCTGSRYFWDTVNGSDDPIDALCERYLRKVPCSRMKPSGKRLDHVLDLAREYKVSGVVYFLLKFCETFQYDFPIFKKELEKEGIPVLRVETEYTEADAGQLRTRIEAFIEMIKR